MIIKMETGITYNREYEAERDKETREWVTIQTTTVCYHGYKLFNLRKGDVDLNNPRDIYNLFFILCNNEMRGTVTQSDYDNIFITDDKPDGFDFNNYHGAINHLIVKYDLGIRIKMHKTNDIECISSGKRINIDEDVFNAINS